jgi:hypothetical protein
MTNDKMINYIRHCHKTNQLSNTNISIRTNKYIYKTNGSQESKETRDQHQMKKPHPQKATPIHYHKMSIGSL